MTLNHQQLVETIAHHLILADTLAQCDPDVRAMHFQVDMIYSGTDVDERSKACVQWFDDHPDKAEHIKKKYIGKAKKKLLKGEQNVTL